MIEQRRVPGEEVIFEKKIYKDIYTEKITANGYVKTLTTCCQLTTDLGFDPSSNISPTAKTKTVKTEKYTGHNASDISFLLALRSTHVSRVAMPPGTRDQRPWMGPGLPGLSH